MGWSISVFRQTDGGLSPATAASVEGTRLAVWQAGLGGLRWIDELVKAGQALDLGGAGYPCRYTARAKHLIPRIVGGPPDARCASVSGPHDVVTSRWDGETAIDRASTDDCRPDEWLLLVAWDES